MSRPHRTSSSRRAMTLIEVLGALVLLATVLVSVLAAQARFTVQNARAERRLVAVSAAEGMLRRWWADPALLPRSGTGPVVGGEQMVWRTSTAAPPQLAELDLQILRLEIVDARAEVTEKARLLASVELVIGAAQGSPRESHGR